MPGLARRDTSPPKHQRAVSRAAAPPDHRAALRLSSVFLLHVGTRDGGGSGGGCAWMGAGARDGALVPEVRDEGGREAGGSGDPSLPGAWLTPAALVGAGRGGGARRAAAAGAVPG